MMGSETMRLETNEMRLRRVARISFPSIVRIAARKSAHQAIARHLRDDRRARDAEAAMIAANDVRMGNAEGAELNPVDEDVIGAQRQARDGAAHGQHRRMKDVEPVDLA